MFHRLFDQRYEINSGHASSQHSDGVLDQGGGKDGKTCHEKPIKDIEKKLFYYIPNNDIPIRTKTISYRCSTY